MFKNLFQKSTQSHPGHIYTPVNGEIIPITEVPDPVFSEKMMGDGIAIIPSDGRFTAPADGEIVQIPETKHAYGIRTTDNVEILVHIGLETVGLKGQGFKTHVEVGDTVKMGDLVITCDLEYIKEHAEHIITPVVITNTNDLKGNITPKTTKNAKIKDTVIMTIT
ncbi:Lactose permease [Lentibacillus sp. JNUCC-1]|uniref:PTS sugar transporter subunit IIA n=1 Tax=Lentibacillus sp. JNUCC-1 TaxID=2654513 RepID=UPI0012E81482|nr:PTS glucose transporter subunit IIA [Lentibacillus sp. JNUCC-1]MUV36394.1 Lactose permease [Lentibacillus sp. JNUCC-1]